LRWLLVQCANHITRRGSPDSDLKRHGAKLAKGGSKVAKRIAKVAVARKLAVRLPALLVSGEVFEPLWNTTVRSQVRARSQGRAAAPEHATSQGQ
jgi:hypothetical protein